MSDDPRRAIGTGSPEQQVAAVQIHGRAGFGGRLRRETGEQRSNQSASLTIRRHVRSQVDIAVEVVHRRFRGLSRNRVEQSICENVDGPVRFERSSQDCGDEVVGVHNGITFFARFGHSARSSFIPLSGSHTAFWLESDFAAASEAGADWIGVKNREDPNRELPPPE